MKTAICAIIKDEHLFLKEWIDWHLGLGFDAIHLFEDKGSDSHEDIVKEYDNVFLRRYEDDEELQEILVMQGSSYRQQVLYEYFINQYKNTYSWAAFIDLDEFIVFNGDYNLNKLCEEFKEYPAVYMNWRMLGASGRISYPKCGVMEAYNLEGEFPGNDKMWAQKSFVNLKNFIGFKDLHRALGAVNTNHSKNLYELCYNKVILNHYFTKSFEDWLDRIYKRGGTLNGHRLLCHFFECNPSMKYLEDNVYDKYVQHIPNGTYKIKGNIIAGGNTNKIALLNCKTHHINYTPEERLDIAIREASKYGFENNGKEHLVHIIWLGKKKFPELTVKCMESWKKYLINQTLCIWTEDSLDLSHDFVNVAYNNKSYAFASDYLRLWVIYNYGGVYLDTDVELLKPIQSLPKNFMGIENEFNSIALGLIFGAEKENEVIYDMMSMYNHFFFNPSKKDSFISPTLTTKYFESRGYVYNDNIQTYLGFTIFPSEYFSPYNYFSKKGEITDNTYSIHHYMESWKNN